MAVKGNHFIEDAHYCLVYGIARKMLMMAIKIVDCGLRGFCEERNRQRVVVVKSFLFSLLIKYYRWRYMAIWMKSTEAQIYFYCIIAS